MIKNRLMVDSDTFILWLGPRDDVHSKSFGIHVDFPWSYDVKTYGAPCRIYLHLYWWSGTIGAKTQAWTRNRGWHGPLKWAFVSFHPVRWRQCRTRIQTEKLNRRGEPMFSECGRKRGHRGDCVYG